MNMISLKEDIIEEIKEVHKKWKEEMDIIAKTCEMDMKKNIQTYAVEILKTTNEKSNKSVLQAENKVQLMMGKLFSLSLLIHIIFLLVIHVWLFHHGKIHLVFFVIANEMTQSFQESISTM